MELFVAEDPTFNGIYMVRERGDILLAGAGRIQVAGMTVVEAEARIRSKLEASQLKSATVTLDRVGRAREDASKLADSDSDKLGVIRIFMTGRVAKPGQHRIPVPDSGILGVYDALLIAGGPISFADLPKVHLLRRDEAGRRHKIPVDVEKIERGEIPDPPIGDGDVLVVPEKVFGF